MNVERCLVLIKPDGLLNVAEVMRKIFYAGFNTIQRKYFVLSSDEVLEFCTIAGSIFDENQAAGKVLPKKESTYMAVCVSKENAIWELKQMFVNDIAIHVSQCSSAAHREIHFFFPNLWTESIDRSRIDEIIDCTIQSHLFPILSKSLLDVVEKCPPRENAINQLRTAMIFRNPMKPIAIEPGTTANAILEKKKNWNRMK